MMHLIQHNESKEVSHNTYDRQLEKLNDAITEKTEYDVITYK